MSTIGLNAGWVATSLTCSPSIHTSRPSARDCRYSSPVLITMLPSRWWWVRLSCWIRLEPGDLAPEGHDVIAGRLGVELFGVAAAGPHGRAAVGQLISSRAAANAVTAA